MAPLIIVLLGALAVFWYLGLLTPERLRIIAGVGAALIGLYVLLRGQPFIGVPLIGVGGYLGWSALKRPQADGMSEADAARILSVRTGVSVEEVRTAHRLAIASAHPDRGGTDAASAEINQARDILIAAALKRKPDRRAD